MGAGEKPTPRLDSHQNSVQNGMVDNLCVLTATISGHFLIFVYLVTIFGNTQAQKLDVVHAHYLSYTTIASN